MYSRQGCRAAVRIRVKNTQIDDSAAIRPTHYPLVADRRPVNLFSAITDCPNRAGGSQKSLLAFIATSSMLIRRCVCFLPESLLPSSKGRAGGDGRRFDRQWPPRRTPPCPVGWQGFEGDSAAVHAMSELCESRRSSAAAVTRSRVNPLPSRSPSFSDRLGNKHPIDSTVMVAHLTLEER